MRLLNLYKQSDKLITTPLLFSLTLTVLSLLIFLINYGSLPPRVPLFYSLSWGQSQLVSKSQFILLPALLLVTTLLNSLIVYHLHPSQEALRKMLMASLIIVSLIIFITSVKIVYIFV